MSYLKVITGPMFSGKSEELIRLVKRSQISEKKCLIVKPKFDHRTLNQIISRSAGQWSANTVSNADEFSVLINTQKASVICIDEAQFFGEWLIDQIDFLLHGNPDSNYLIFAAGLDLDFRRKPFKVVADLMAMADEVQKLTAICTCCKEPANLSAKLANPNQRLQVGDADIYQPRCRTHHTLPSTK